MSVVGTALELPNSPELNLEVGKMTATRYLRVITDSYNDGPFVAVSAIGVPRAYQSYAFYNDGTWINLRCRRVTPRRAAPNSLVWHIEAYYETPEIKERGIGADAGGGAGVETAGGLDNPLLELCEIDMSFESHKIPITSIYDPNAPQNTPVIHPIRASNGEVYSEPPEKDDSRLIMTFERNEDLGSPHPFLSVMYQDTVCSDAWGWGLQAGQAKITSITAKRMTRQLPSGLTFAYLRVKYEMRLAPSFDIQVLDSGSFYVKEDASPGNGNQRVIDHFLTNDGHPLERGLLDGTGHKLADNLDPIYFTIRPYRRQPFAALNLPNNWAACQ